MAFPTGWGRVCPVVIDHNQVAGNGSHTDFPVLVTADMLPAEMFDSDGSFPALNGGGDVRFSSDLAGTVQLPLEVVSFVTDTNPANGSAELWVRDPSLSATVDTTIYVWYNKAGEVQPAVTDPYGRNAVWTAFNRVYHLDGTGTQIDSTGNGYDLTESGNPVASASAIGNGVDLDGNDSYSAASASRGDGSFTESVWFSAASTPSVSWLSDDGDGTTGGFQTLILQTAGNLRTRLDDSGSNGGVFDTTTVVDDGTPRLLHTVVDKAGSATHYLDGVQDGGSLNLAGYGNISATSALKLGISVDGIGGFVGSIDEYRIAASALSPDWNATEFANQSSPGAFAAAGTPQTPGAGTTPITTDLNLQWNVLQQLTTDTDTRWNILNAVETDLQAAWNLLNHVTRDEFTSWDILQQLTRDVNISWDVLAALYHITTDITLLFNIINAVQRDQQTAWNILNQVTRDQATAWNLLNAMTRDVQTGWHILEAVEQDVNLHWNVASNLTAITTDLNLHWNLLQGIVRSFDTQWDLLEAITGDTEIRWHVANAVVAELNTHWDIANQVVTDYTLSWNLIEAMENSLTLHWSVDGRTIAPISFIPIPPEIREIPIPAENRLIPVRRA